MTLRRLPVYPMFNATGVLAGLLVLMPAVIVIDLALKWLDARLSYWKPAR